MFLGGFYCQICRASFSEQHSHIPHTTVNPLSSAPHGHPQGTLHHSAHSSIATPLQGRASAVYPFPQSPHVINIFSQINTQTSIIPARRMTDAERVYHSARQAPIYVPHSSATQTQLPIQHQRRSQVQPQPAYMLPAPAPQAAGQMGNYSNQGLQQIELRVKNYLAKTRDLDVPQPLTHCQTLELAGAGLQNLVSLNPTFRDHWLTMDRLLHNMHHNLVQATNGCSVDNFPQIARQGLYLDNSANSLIGLLQSPDFLTILQSFKYLGAYIQTNKAALDHLPIYAKIARMAQIVGNLDLAPENSSTSQIRVYEIINQRDLTPLISAIQHHLITKGQYSNNPAMYLGGDKVFAEAMANCCHNIVLLYVDLLLFRCGFMRLIGEYNA